MDELKACPFCGGEAEIRDWWRSDSGTVFYVQCLGAARGTGCRLTTGAYSTVKEASDMWNRRCKEDALRADNDKLRALIQRMAEIGDEMAEIPSWDGKLFCHYCSGWAWLNEGAENIRHAPYCPVTKWQELKKEIEKGEGK